MRFKTNRFPRIRSCRCLAKRQQESQFFIGNLLVRIHLITEMIRWTGLAPWEFEFPFPGSLISTRKITTKKGHGLEPEKPRPESGLDCLCVPYLPDSSPPKKIQGYLAHKKMFIPLGPL